MCWQIASIVDGHCYDHDVFIDYVASNVPVPEQSYGWVHESQTRLDMTVLVAVHEIEWTYSHVMCWVCWREHSIYRDLNEVKIGEMINWVERL